MPKGWGYRIASLVLVALLGLTLASAFFGWGLPGTAATRAAREAIARRRGVRVGSSGGRYAGGGGPRFGK
ncbi:MAG: hypothetical protein H7Z41_16360 [Cytophagales bacterium]|nr:hypothetical protein [Armatimonadota bacterium]